MLNTAAVERAVRRIGRDLERLIATDPNHAERVRAMLPAPDAAPTPEPTVLEPGDVEVPAVEVPAVEVPAVPAKKAAKAATQKTTG